MKRTLTLLVLLVIFSSCGSKKKVSFETGVNGKVYYAEGPCGPVDAPKEYQLYNGSLCILKMRDHRRILDNRNSPGYGLLMDSLIAKSKAINIQNGVISTSLEPDTFIVNFCGEIRYDKDHIIYINEMEVLEKDFYFIKCTERSGL